MSTWFETVMNDEEMGDIVDNAGFKIRDYATPSDYEWLKKVKGAQAKISFKAGREQEKKDGSKPIEEQELTELAQMLFNFRNAMRIENIKASIESFLLANHYVKLLERKPYCEERQI